MSLERIDILGTEYETFKFKKELMGDFESKDKNWGLAHQDGKYIEWIEQKDTSETAGTLGHEIGHALFQELHYPEAIDEEQAAWLCGDLLKTLVRNPSLLKYVNRLARKIPK